MPVGGADGWNSIGGYCLRRTILEAGPWVVWRSAFSDWPSSSMIGAQVELVDTKHTEGNARTLCLQDWVPLGRHPDFQKF